MQLSAPRSMPALAMVLACAACNCGAPAPGSPPAKAEARPTSPAPPATPPTTPTELLLPTDGEVMAPNLTVSPAGVIHMSWIAVADGAKSRSVMVASRKGAEWGEPHEVASAPDVLANWADFPSVVELNGGELVAHFHTTQPAAPHGYDVSLARSGPTWTAMPRPHGDDVPAEHGFVSIVPETGGGFSVFWLDGRKTVIRDGGPPGATMLMARRYPPDGEPGPEVVLDERVCDCCQTDAIATPAGPVVAYRDRTTEEIRDVSIVRRTGESWSTPAPVHLDGWTISGCPVNGPAIAADGKSLAVAWFTGANDSSRVFVAWSTDAGATFGTPLRLGEDAPLGRVDLAMLGPAAGLATWMEPAEGNGGRATIYAQRVSATPPTGSPVRIGETSAARASGFPRTAIAGGEALWVWTDVDENDMTTVHGAKLPVTAFGPASRG